MLVDDDVPGDAEPEAGSVADLLGREEGLEDPGQVLAGNARAVVGDLAPDGLVVGPGPDRDESQVGATLPADGLGCVHQDVEDHLVQLPHVAQDGRDFSEVDQASCGVLDLVVGDDQGVGQGRVEIGEGEVVPAVHPSERAQAADDVGDALQPVGVLVQELRHVLDEEVDIQIALKLEDLALRPAFAVGAHERHQVAEVVAERAEVAGHEADRIVDLVRHARRELPDGRQPFGVEQLRVGRREFAHGLQVPDGLGEAGGQAIEEFGSPGAEVVALGVEEHQRQRIGPPVDLGHDRRACRGWAERIAAGAAPGVEVDHRLESAGTAQERGGGHLDRSRAAGRGVQDGELAAILTYHGRGAEPEDRRESHRQFLPQDSKIGRAGDDL